MSKNKLIRVTKKIVRLENVHSVGVIGDPGCDGLGTYNMKVYAGALEACGGDDLTLVVGDLVPAGSAYYYRTMVELTESLAGNDVYALRGNHDTGAYADYFGEKSYALLAEHFAVIVLDNATRSFEEESLALLREVLAMDEVKQAILAFHIPVPNHFIQNSVSQEEFGQLQEAYAPHRDKVKYLLCGHVHSRFVDEVDGIPLICTGGGGAMIEDVSRDIRACDVEHHVVHFCEENGVLHYEIRNIPESCYPRERTDAVLRGKLEETVQGELMAHFKYLMFADRAERRGMDYIANLFRALAASEYYHARNFFAVIDQPLPFVEAAEAFVPGEQFEYEYMYRMLVDYAKEHDEPLAHQAYATAAFAEQEHASLLEKAGDLERFNEEKIYVCPICGHLMAGDAPERCPVCGGVGRQYEVYEVKEGER